MKTLGHTLSDATCFSKERSRQGLHRYRLKSERWNGEEYSCRTLLTSALKATSSLWYTCHLFCWFKPGLFGLFLLLVWVQLPREGDLSHFAGAISALGNWHGLACLGSHCSQWKRMSSPGDDSTHFMIDIREKQDELPYRQTLLSLLRI